jgi:2-haloacid dehalogenase
MLSSAVKERSPMPTTLAFDVYGTLIDTHGVIDALKPRLADRAGEFSRAWRDKQLEYSFRRGLMQNYQPFSVCTSQALEFACSRFGLHLDPEGRMELLAAYGTLPAFKDVAEGLALIREAGFRMFAFSNGSAEAVEPLLAQAGLRGFFLDVVSVDEVQSFKPNPGVYAHFLRRAAAAGADAWLISSNPFDVIGALSAGMRSAWVRRDPDALFDPWGLEPTLTVETLVDLAGRFAAK